MTIIGNKYELIKKINQGSFGALYQGKNIRTGKIVAIKVEKKNDNLINTLKYEANVYNYLKKVDNFVKLRWFGKDEKYNFLVIDLLGNSLKNIVNTTKNNLELVLHFGKKIINKLMILHENKIIHRDIKPDNILLNSDNSFEDIFIIDFSFCKKYINSDFKHISEKKINNIIGSMNYISLNVHNLIEPSRRDDLESVMYVLLYLYYGRLEWDNSSDLNFIYETKKNIIFNENVPNCFKNIISYIRMLEFNERPNYFYIMNCFV
jgi:serine/threonine protein kinase